MRKCLILFDNGARTGATIDTAEPFPMGRYTVIKLLGSGTYGKVVEAEDNKYNKTHVAIKLVRLLRSAPF